MKLRSIHWVGIIGSLAIALGDFLFFFVLSGEGANMDFFLFIMGIALAVLLVPFVVNIVLEGKRQERISEMFLEFSRGLAESVSTGTPVSKSIINMSKKNFGPLTPYIIKLANQIAVGIPVHKALETFAIDVDSPVISRSVTLISEAERAGGEIDYILESSSKAIAEVEKLKKERKSAVYSLVVQGYIIFFIFIGVMLIMQFRILPLTNNIASFNVFGGDFSSVGLETSSALPAEPITPEKLANNFLYLLLTQGIFSGLIIGKLTEGTLKSGVKHSFILTTAAFLITTGVRALVGTPGVTT